MWYFCGRCCSEEVAAIQVKVLYVIMRGVGSISNLYDCIQRYQETLIYLSTSYNELYLHRLRRRNEMKK